MTQNFIVRTAIDPQSLPRVVGQLARLWLTPSRLAAEQVNDEMVIDFVVQGLPHDKADIVAAVLRSNVLIHHVELSAESGAA